MKELILAFETSCDDTSIAVIDTDYKVYSNIISSQLEHDKYGGVVPEIASRLHMKKIMDITNIALNEANVKLEDISAIAVSVNPGLIGSLLVGLSFAKSLAFTQGVPLITVNHMLGHIFANKIEHPDLKPPYLALVVSGGHTELVYFTTETEFEIIGRTRDDAAGEAFDKTAKLLGLGYPGGPIVDKYASQGDPEFVDFPLGLNRKDNFDFSFSGLKTSVRNYLSQHDAEFIKENEKNICASLQKAIVNVLTKKTINYAKKMKIDKIIIAGGVSANRGLRAKMKAEAKKIRAEVYVPKLRYCMDNGAMIGAAAVSKYKRGEFSALNVNAFSTKGVRYL
ncbi:MAG: tRNA (adenosine(37)-N6)-threonylcarbamoyltransferase complex transferase subunit TsaD [Candidatus Cloacimonetes bacterium 4572_65]|nr:MAG: tRNA (adenosine(37)-N6)-threonylcarbamoyltransferase complex transferase subunit TsaD [Candidatus Cloacimonetes bacterium 4572_65]